MRIACIHIPQFALQCATRLDPAQRGAAVAVVSAGTHGNGVRAAGVLHAPIVVACSRAAWTAGVRLGMTAAAVRQLDQPVEVTTVDGILERETVRAIADAVLGLTGVVDLGGRVGGAAHANGAIGDGAHLAMYAEVPAKTRGQAFGDRVLERLEELGLTGRVGIADDRFTAWVAAAVAPVAATTVEVEVHRARPHGDTSHDVTMVPRGGSAAFLAPRPLSLLAISSEVQHMLEALGVRTLGEFAALPAPSVASRPPALEADYQALARGESGTLLRPYAPEAAIREDIVVGAGNVLDAPMPRSVQGPGGPISGPTAIALVARRLALRLAGRGRGAAKLELVRTEAGAEREHDVTIKLDHPLAEAEDLARVLAPALDGASTTWRLRVVVVGEAIAGAHDADASVFTLSQELSLPVVDLASAGRGIAAAATRAVGAPAAANANADAATANTAQTSLLAPRFDTSSRASESLATAAFVGVPQVSDPLAVVLSTSGSLFALSSPQAGDRRERPRFRRGKLKLRRTRAVTVPGQSRLFERG